MRQSTPLQKTQGVRPLLALERPGPRVPLNIPAKKRYAPFMDLQGNLTVLPRALRDIPGPGSEYYRHAPFPLYQEASLTVMPFKDSLDEQAESDRDACIVCLSNRKRCVVMPCRHLCLCMECSHRLPHQLKKCPVCAKSAEQIVLVFG
jgi:Zinc finger, C3HC4 type (RING finger)